MSNKTRPERMSAEFDVRRVRAALAAGFITQRQLAEASQLSESWINQVLGGRQAPGRLARIEIERGLARLGLDPADVLGDGTLSARPMGCNQAAHRNNHPHTHEHSQPAPPEKRKRTSRRDGETVLRNGRRRHAVMDRGTREEGSRSMPDE